MTLSHEERVKIIVAMRARGVVNLFIVLFCFDLINNYYWLGDEIAENGGYGRVGASAAAWAAFNAKARCTDSLPNE